MNYTASSQDPLNSIANQLQDISFSGSVTPLSENNGNPVPLHRSTSLLDSIGIQRASSPFVSQDSGLLQPMVQQPFAPQASMMGWTQPVNNSHVRQQAQQLHPSSSTPMSSATNLAFTGSFNGQLRNPLANPVPLDSSGTSASTPSTFSSTPLNGGFAPAPPPPGMFAIPQQSQWKYVDTQGTIQGPFPSQSMKSWYQAGYFQPSLQLCRLPTSPEPFGVNDCFISLGDLISKVGDVVDPFDKFDAILAQSQQLNVTAQQNHRLQTGNPVELDVNNKRTAQIESPDYTHSEILHLRSENDGHYQEVVTAIPVHKFVEKVDKFEFHASKMDTSSSRKHLEVQRQRDLLQAKLIEEEEKQKEREEQHKREEAQNQEKEELTRKKLEEINKRAKTKEEVAAFKKADEMAHETTKQEIKKHAENGVEKTALKFVDQTDAHHTKKETKQSSQLAAEQAKEERPKEEISTAAKPKLAPWANKTVTTTPVPSLAEIQQKEAAEKMKREQERERKERELALKLQQQALSESKPEVNITSIATWAKKPASTSQIEGKPIKSFEQIQKEQLQEKSFIEEQKRLWEEAQKVGRAKKTAPVSNASDNVWTTVTKKPSSQPKQQPKVTQTSSHINPDKLRSVSAASVKKAGSSVTNPTVKAPAVATISTYTGNASTSVRQEFLRWCRSQLKLSPGVDSNGVLEVLLSLPAGSESKEIIADTIYSNSSIMDGRRFAIEFIKKRVECEKKLNDPLTWSEALLMPEGNDDDWEFQIVGKKKNRRH